MILLDTHTIYWFLSENATLPEKTRMMIENDDKVFISIISFWEMAIKNSLGKMGLPAPITEMMSSCEKLGFKILDIAPEHLETLKSLPFIHRDPFDRLLICQAKSENLLFVTKDENIPKYDVRTYWE